ncbi:MAG: GldG family protein [Dehalococcoidia bacterium]
MVRDQSTTETKRFSRLLPSNRKGVISFLISLTGLLALFIGLIFYAFLPETQNTAITTIVLGILLILIGMLISYKEVLGFIIQKKGRYSINSSIMVMAFILIGVLIYVLAARNSIRIDTTATRQYSLANQTTEILQNLTNPITATAFFVPTDTTSASYRISTENLLNEFKHRSTENAKFSYKYIDPDLEPTLAKNLGVSEYPSIVFQGQNTDGVDLSYTLTAPLFEERDISTAIMIASGIQQKKIYIVTGHGERDTTIMDINDRLGFGLARESMRNDNYAVQTLSIAQYEVIPDDAAALVIPGPTIDLSDIESNLIHQYLKSGGRLLLSIDPGTPSSYNNLINKWGITIIDGTVIDLGSSLANQPKTPLIQQEQFVTVDPINVITDPLSQVYFPGTAAFDQILPADEMPEYIRAKPILGTTMLSCLQINEEINTCNQNQFTILAPSMAVEALKPINEESDENAARQTKIVLFGDTDFISNYHFYNFNNSDLYLNSLNWLTEDVSLASVRAKALTYRRLVVTDREIQLIRGLSWFALPGLMTLLAFMTWWRRR